MPKFKYWKNENTIINEENSSNAVWIENDEWCYYG
jgi:hypothetical protein